jgi:hypothetical protein
MSGKGDKRDTETPRQRDRETERQRRDRETERQREIERERAENMWLYHSIKFSDPSSLFVTVCSSDVFIYQNSDLDAFVSRGGPDPVPIVTRQLRVPRKNIEVNALGDDMFVSVGGENCVPSWTYKKYYGKRHESSDSDFFCTDMFDSSHSGGVDNVCE